MSTTALTVEQIKAIQQTAYSVYTPGHPDRDVRFARAIEQAVLQSQPIEAIAAQWDGCIYQAADGSDIDIGQAIRRAAKRSDPLQSQDRTRLQFLADEGCSINARERTDGSLEYQLYWEGVMKWQDDWFDSPEEAIDHASRIEGNRNDE